MARKFDFSVTTIVALTASGGDYISHGVGAELGYNSYAAAHFWWQSSVSAVCVMKTIANKRPSVGAELSYNTNATATKRAVATPITKIRSLSKPKKSKIQHEINIIFKSKPILLEVAMSGLFNNSKKYTSKSCDTIPLSSYFSSKQRYCRCSCKVSERSLSIYFRKLLEHSGL
jgi:hypothetical protein